MNLSHFKLKIGSKELTGISAILLGILILIPVLAIVGAILSVVFSIVGVVISIALGIAGLAIIIMLIAKILPKKWRDKLEVTVNWKKHSNERPQKTVDGKTIVDVNYKDDKY